MPSLRRARIVGPAGRKRGRRAPLQYRVRQLSGVLLARKPERGREDWLE